MSTSAKDTMPDLASLAAEACDLWQEHLATYTQDSEAKAAMVRLMEPQRQLLSTLFADYTTMMQNARHGAPSPTPSSSGPDVPSPGTATSGVASDDIALRLAQLAHRVAYLEKQCADLEQRLARYEHRGDLSPATATQPTE